MKMILCNKKYSGILLAIVFASAFAVISLVGKQFFSGTEWFIFSSILRFVFGFIILIIVKKLYDRPTKEVLSTKGSKSALVAGCGFIFYCNALGEREEMKIKMKKIIYVLRLVRIKEGENIL